MAKGRKGSSGGRAKSGPHAPGPEALLEELSAKARAIATIDASQQGPAWGEVHRLLLRTSADRAEIGRVVARRDADALLGLIAALRGDVPEESDAELASAAESGAPDDDDAGELSASSSSRTVDDETMKKAMRAFRKRLKLTRLDHESRLGVGPLSGGKKADVDAIMAPREFADDVWEALAESGQLRRVGKGFYMLPPQ